jgi:hypothetical protein
MPNGRVQHHLGALLILLATASGGEGYIHFPPKTLVAMCKQSHTIRLLKVEKASPEKGIIVFQMSERLKGGQAQISSFKHVLPDGLAGAKPIRAWMAKGKTAIQFSIEGPSAGKQIALGYVFIDNFCYSVDYNDKDKYWLVIRAAPGLSECYHGSVEQLRKAIQDVLGGKNVKAPVAEPKNKEDPEKRRNEISDFLKKHR